MINKIKNRKGSLFCVILAVISIFVMLSIIQYNVENERNTIIQVVALVLNIPSLILNGINLFRK